MNYYYFCFHEMSIKPFFNARLTSLTNKTALLPLFLHFPRLRSVVSRPVASWGFIGYSCCRRAGRLLDLCAGCTRVWEASVTIAN